MGRGERQKSIHVQHLLHGGMFCIGFIQRSRDIEQHRFGRRHKVHVGDVDQLVPFRKIQYCDRVQQIRFRLSQMDRFRFQSLLSHNHCNASIERSPHGRVANTHSTRAIKFFRLFYHFALEDESELIDHSLSVTHFYSSHCEQSRVVTGCICSPAFRDEAILVFAKMNNRKPHYCAFRQLPLFDTQYWEAIQLLRIHSYRRDQPMQTECELKKLTESA